MNLPVLLARTAAADSVPLDGRVVLITGSSRGLGLAIARTVGRCGARVVLADIAADRVRDSAAMLTDEGVAASAVSLDVADEAQCRAAVDAAHDRWGRLDALVNNAAIDITAPINEITDAEWARVLATNLGGPFLLCKHAATLMARAGGGHIVNIASTASKRAWPNASAYHATKWGLLGLSHALHAELRPRGIKVCAVVAGGMRTAFLLERFPDLDPALLQDPMNVARVVRMVLEQPEETAIPEVTVLPMRETSWP